MELNQEKPDQTEKNEVVDTEADMNDIKNENIVHQQIPALNNQYQISLSKQIILVLLCIFTMAPVLFNYDLPQSLQTQLRQSPYMLDSQNFNLIYTFSLLPNILLSVIGAYVTTKLGATKSMLISVVLVMLSQLLILICVQTVWSGWYITILISRMIQSYAGLNIQISQAVIITKYCHKKHVSSFIACLSVGPWIFEAVDSFVTPLVYSKTESVSICVLIGFLFTIFGFLCALVLILYLRSLLRNQSNHESQQKIMPKLEFDIIRKLGKITFVLFSIHLVESSFQEPILVNSNDMLHQRVGFSNIQAGRIFMCTYICLAVGIIVWTYIYSWMEDRKKLFLIMALLFFTALMLLMTLPSFVSLQSTFQSVFAYILIGFKDSLGLILLDGSIPLIVSQEMLPLAFSFVISGQYIGSGISVFVTGVIIKESDSISQGYKNCFYLYFAYFAIYVGILDYMAFTTNTQAIKINRKMQVTNQQV